MGGAPEKNDGHAPPVQSRRRNFEVLQDEKTY